MKKDSMLIMSYALILLLIIVSIFTKYIYPIDHTVYHFIQNNTIEFRLHNYLTIISYIFSPLHTVFLIAVIFIGLYFYNKHHFLPYLIFTITALITGTLLKYIIQRPRPSDLIEGFSFPSLHTLMLFVAIFILLALYNTYIVKWISLILIISMMCSRIYLNAHFFSDTVASLIIVHLVYLTVHKILERHPLS